MVFQSSAGENSHKVKQPDILKETADSVIQSQDMERIFEEAKRNYDADKAQSSGQEELFDFEW